MLRGELGQIATFKNHALLAYVRHGSSGEFKLVLTQSDDQGRSWHASGVITSRLPIGLPSVAVDGRGDIAVVYDEIKSDGIVCGDNPPNAEIPARTIVAVSRDRGHSWKTVTVGANWWNFGAGGAFKFFGGYWVADYQGIAATPHGFITATPQGPAMSGKEPIGGITGDMSIVAGEISVRSEH